ncbi:hypothetical protein HYV88_00435 [Candidatus Woesearchaeota archaeon]|nr:hypothetical protein [Candidatus Woesearchaeota archaeon]
MRKADYDKLVALCSMQMADEPYLVHTMVPPVFTGSISLRYDPKSRINEEISKKVEAQWNLDLEKAKAELAEKGIKTEIRPHDGSSPSLALYNVETSKPVRFSRPMMKYESHSVSFMDSRKYQAIIYLGQTNFVEQTTVHKINPVTVVWSFGPSSFVILTDDESKRYVLLGDRSKGIQHTDQEIEREFYPKGYFYTEGLSELSGDDMANRSPLETLIKKQLAEQSNLPDDIIESAKLESLGAFFISAPHFGAGVGHTIHIKLPCKVEDFGQFHKGSKYTGSSTVRLEDLAGFVEVQGNNLMPISRHLLWSYAIRHPELVE